MYEMDLKPAGLCETYEYTIKCDAKGILGFQDLGNREF